ncbi:type IV pilus twitching motility protein PilT [Pantoea sp. 1.19]|uniref:type IV pilus twitching motility protein PilT n=1 Tax=Pantoea sp. 1.19 TaxID=1925589 RepID=UPI0009490446|nr:PilT/PilU family type 4a pilus ATPase [Pantoea sp. 1.19]
MNVAEMVTLSVNQNASDLHLCSGHFPRWRCEGRLSPLPNAQPLAASVLAAWAEQQLDARQRARLAKHGQLDFALTVCGHRLRANLFYQHHGLSLALRRLATEAPTPAALGLPAAVTALTDCDGGLILVSGATGSGKSTTLTALVAAMHQQPARHIITLEDPIEYLYGEGASLIQQREVGEHCASFSEGLRAALREDPDVILLGELRDADSIRLALTAAETGHLVLATLHARHAAQAIERLVDVFPAEEKATVRSQLAGSLRAVVAQRLVPAAGCGRVALFELLLSTPAVATLIREGKGHQLPGLMETASRSGMQTFAQSLAQRQAAGVL